jgi:hypothetical protein
MAYAYTIPDDMLAPGDLLDVDFLITSDNDTLVGMAIQDVKKALWADPRFDYQGSAWQTREDGRHLIVTVSVRTTLKGERVPIQQAGLGVTALIAIALVVGAVIAWKCLDNRGYTIRRGIQAAQHEEAERIRQDETLTQEQKAVQLQALYSQAVSAPRIGGGISNILASLGTGGLVVAGLVLWAIFAGRNDE